MLVNWVTILPILLVDRLTHALVRKPGTFMGVATEQVP